MRSVNWDVNKPQQHPPMKKEQEKKLNETSRSLLMPNHYASDSKDQGFLHL